MAATESRYPRILAQVPNRFGQSTVGELEGDIPPTDDCLPIDNCLFYTMEAISRKASEKVTLATASAGFFVLILVS